MRRPRGPADGRDAPERAAAPPLSSKQPAPTPPRGERARSPAPALQAEPPLRALRRAATGDVLLRAHLQAHPEALGSAVRQRFGDDLPFLLKVRSRPLMSALSALSAQSAPSAAAPPCPALAGARAAPCRRAPPPAPRFLRAPRRATPP